MAVKIKTSKIYDILCTGKLIDFTDTELIFEDKKGISELPFDVIRDLIGCEISFKITNKTEVEVED